jgi:hypothetical protein
MGKVLTKDGTVKCGHGGSATLSGGGKLTVGGIVVMRTEDIGSWSIAGCGQTNADKSQVICATIASVSGGESTKLFVGGSPVLLETLSALSKEGKPLNDVAAQSAGQNKLSSV